MKIQKIQNIKKYKSLDGELIELMYCKLCGKKEKTIRSHVIPEWAYLPLYKDIDDERKKSLIMIGANLYTKRRPIGSYDCDILCKKCDGLLAKYDDIGKRFFLDGEILKDGLIEKIGKPDIRSLRLFILSVIWRADISTLHEFVLVALGPYSEKIRKILFEDLYNNKSNDEVNSYSIIISRYKSEKIKDTVENIVQFPYNHRAEDGLNIVCLFLPRAFKIHVKFDRRVLPEELQNFEISSDLNFVRILPLGNIEDSGDYKALLNAVHNSKR